MAEATGDKEAAAHKFFSAKCFNEAWTLIEKADRTAEETEAMIDLAHASRHHWRHREDLQPLSQSISEWQLSRVYAVAGKPKAALRYARRCIDISEAADLPPFYRAYAHEAMARAASLTGDAEMCREHLELARGQAEAETDADNRKALEDDLATVEVPSS
ncbi:MAG: hypothetical protein ACYTG6_00525 [Planctomycetota bacterium]